MDEDPDPITPALAGYTGYLLARAFVRAREAARTVIPPGRHPGEIPLLGMLKERGPASQRALSDRLGINRTMMVKIVDRLEESGFVQRDRNPADRRSYALTITDAGVAALADMGRVLGRAQATLLEPLTPREQARLDELLSALLPASAQPPAALTARTGYFVSITHFRLREQGRLALRSLGLEPRGFGLLATLAAVEPCSQQRLAAEMRVSGPAIVGLIDEMERDGRIERRRNPDDRRAHLVRLTAKGRADLAEARRAIDEIQDGFAGIIGRDGLDELNALLRKLQSRTPADR